MKDVIDKAEELKMRLQEAADADKGSRLSADECKLVDASLDFYCEQLRMLEERYGDPAMLDERFKV